LFGDGPLPDEKPTVFIFHFPWFFFCGHTDFFPTVQAPGRTVSNFYSMFIFLIVAFPPRCPPPPARLKPGPPFFSTQSPYPCRRGVFPRCKNLPSPSLADFFSPGNSSFFSFFPSGPGHWPFSSRVRLFGPIRSHITPFNLSSFPPVRVHFFRQNSPPPLFPARKPGFPLLFPLRRCNWPSVDPFPPLLIFFETPGSNFFELPLRVFFLPTVVSQNTWRAVKSLLVILPPQRCSSPRSY